MSRIKNNGRTRQINLEMLRIVTMFMIITLHFLAHGGILNSIQLPGAKYYFYWSAAGICYVAVNCYVLITGYFQSRSQFRLKKLLLLFAEVWFYSIVIYAGLCLLDVRPFTVKDFLTALFPALNSEYWFVTIYIGLYVLSPFINWALDRLEQRQHMLLIVVLTLLFSVWPTFFFLSVSLNFGGGFGIVWFFVLYCIGAYIRKYVKKDRNVWRWAGAFVILAGMIPLSKFVIAGISGKYLNNFVPDSMFYSYNSILVLGASIALFGTFLRIEIKDKFFSDSICFFAGSVFGVYLIHDNPFVREYMWQTLNMPQYVDRAYFLFIMAGIVLLIFLSGTIIDKVRIWLFGRLLRERLLEKICGSAEAKALEIYYSWDKEEEHD